MNNGLIKYNKIGILGGSFDPIHFGHLEAAEAVRAKHGLDAIMLLPAGKPAFKQDKEMATAEQRYEMCKLAISDGYPSFFVSRAEIDRGGITYTIDTLRKFKQEMPSTELFFIVGTDAAQNFSKWRNADEILKLCTLIEMPRKDSDISSTMVRDAVKNIEPLNGLVPFKVEKYIVMNGLYNTHLQGVAAEAVALGRHFDFNDEKLAKIRKTAFLHDNAKSFCKTATFEEISEICNRGGYFLEDFFIDNKSIAHCYAGAVLAKEEYGIDDIEILDAIASHTFGEPNMTLFQKIIYLVDFFEPNRPQNEAIRTAKKLAYEDIDRAMAYVLKYTIEYNEKKGKAVHPLSVKALEFYQRGE